MAAIHAQQHSLPTSTTYSGWGVWHLRVLMCSKLLHLMQVQEAASACVEWLHLPDVAINLANLYLAQRQIPAAIQLYTTTLQKHYKNNSTIMLYLARALYDAGKNSQAKRVLLKAIHLQPTQTLLRFNSAVTMQVRPLHASCVVPQVLALLLCCWSWRLQSTDGSFTYS